MFSATPRAEARSLAAITTRSAPARVSLIRPRTTSSGQSAPDVWITDPSNATTPRYLSMIDFLSRPKVQCDAEMLSAPGLTLQMFVKETRYLGEGFLCFRSGCDHSVFVVR